MPPVLLCVCSFSYCGSHGTAGLAPKLRRQTNHPRTTMGPDRGRSQVLARVCAVFSGRSLSCVPFAVVRQLGGRSLLESEFCGRPLRTGATDPDSLVRGTRNPGRDSPPRRRQTGVNASRRPRSCGAWAERKRQQAQAECAPDPDSCTLARRVSQGGRPLKPNRRYFRFYINDGR